MKTHKRHIESCGRKRKYTREAAHALASRLFRLNGWRVQAYRCSSCGSWHVGHKRIVKPRKVRRRL